MKVLYFAAECKPFSKVGGVGDVAGELPAQLKRLGIDIEVVTPLYGTVRQEIIGKKVKQYSMDFNGKKENVEIYETELSNLKVNLIKNKTYFEGGYSEPYIYSPNIPLYDDSLRFSFFSEASLELIKEKNPDIVHINDWVLGYLPGFMELEGMNQKKVLTVHNTGYQGNIWKDAVRGWNIKKIMHNERLNNLFTDPHLEWNNINPLRLGIELSDMVNTVSPNYCNEIIMPENKETYFEGGKGLEKILKRKYDEGKLIGILNGYKYAFEPTDEKFEKCIKEKKLMKKYLSYEFGNSNDFIIGFVGRAVEQKLKLLMEQINGKSVLEYILDIPDINVAVLATGEPCYESFLKRFIGRKNYSATIKFDREKARQISLGSDIFFMPSLYEPCGITQMESMNNATPPLVRWTGGLVDTVKDYKLNNGTGFGFDGTSRDNLLSSLIITAISSFFFHKNEKDMFRKIQYNCFKKRFLWEDTAKEYIKKIYEPLF
ncbi:MAG: glycogen/starch synthase [Candidatus Nanoarchaeia archaeon]|nr:glycogen/starch synthase [Candidatus Nanoarchaeia archaeon]